jgi:hypothetical protein
MSTADLAKQLAEIVERPDTKADRARALFGLGCERTDVVELLSMNYSQAHSIWKKMQNGNVVSRGTTSPVPNHGYSGRPKSSSVLESSGVGSKEGSAVPHSRQLHFSPTQTRFITQDGHVVVRVDKDRGPFCRNCGKSLDFSLKWLGFVHQGSSSEPTGIEDRYE